MRYMRRKILVSALITALVGYVLAMPPVAQAAPPAIAFGELPVTFDADISPDGKRIAIISNVDGIYRVSTTLTKEIGAQSIVVSLGEGIKPEYVRWVNNDRYVVSVEKLEAYNDVPFTVGYLFTNDVTDKKKGRFLVKSRDIFRQYNNVVIDWLDDDPDHILMAYSKKEYHPFPSIFKVNVSNGRAKRVLRGRTGVQQWISDGRGTPRVGRGRTNNGTETLLILNPETHKWETYKEFPGLTADTRIFDILKNGTELIIGDYNGRDTLGLYIYDLKAKRVTRELFHNDTYDASGVIVSTDGETVFGAKYVADEEETELIGDYATLIEEIRAKYSDYAVQFVDQTEDGGTIIVRMSTAYDPGGLFIYTREEKALGFLGPRFNNLVAEDMGNVVAVKYTARDGEKIPAYVTMPPTVVEQDDFKNLPFIILPHGGPYGRDARRFDYFAQFFASRGYGVMQMNFRGSEGYGKAYEEAGRNNWLVMQEDVEDATKYLLKMGYADPQRTCVAGWSYGGYAALMASAKDVEGRYHCVVAMAALTDIKDHIRDKKDKYYGGRHWVDDFFGEAMQDKAFREANTPVERAADINVPVFLAHGNRDINVHIDQYKRMKRALEKAGADGTYLEFNNEDHFLSRQENREEFFVELDKFLTRVNGPSEFMAK